MWGGTLKQLDISHNPLGCGGGGGGLEVLGGLQALTALTVQRNQLTEVPDSVKALFNLEILDLSQNLLTSLDTLKGGSVCVICNMKCESQKHVDPCTMHPYIMQYEKCT